MSTALPPAPVATGEPPAVPPPGPGILVLRVVGTLVAVLVVVLTSGNVVARFFHQHRVETQDYGRLVSAVYLNATSGDVRVTTGDPGTSVVLHRVLDWSSGTPRSVETVTDDGHLQVEAQCDSGFVFGGCEIGYELEVPPDVALRISTHTGNVDIDGSASDLVASSHTGNVTVRGARSTRAQVSTTTGNVQLRFAVEPNDVQVTASTGNVLVTVPNGGTPYDVRATTSTGNRTISVPVATTSDRHVTVRTSTGNVDVRTGS